MSSNLSKDIRYSEWGRGPFGPAGERPPAWEDVTRGEDPIYRALQELTGAMEKGLVNANDPDLQQARTLLKNYRGKMNRLEAPGVGMDSGAWRGRRSSTRRIAMNNNELIKIMQDAVDLLELEDAGGTEDLRRAIVELGGPSQWTPYYDSEGEF